MVKNLRPKLDFLSLAADREMDILGPNFDLAGEIGALISEIEKEHRKNVSREMVAKIKKSDFESLPEDVSLIQTFQKNLETIHKNYGKK